MPPGFHWLIAAQFASALADNALLIVVIGVLEVQGWPGWWAPVLKLGFTASYVLLAPFLGPMADAMRKERLMAWMNGVKVVGVLALLWGVHPAIAYAVVGFGAAAYAPAKYGLVTEVVGCDQLVAANGWIEVTVVCAALCGAVLGGLLVSPWVLQSPWNETAVSSLYAGGLNSTGLLGGSLLALLGVYALAALLNIGVPDSGVRYPAAPRRPLVLMREFWQANRTLWRDRDGGLSLAVTTIFWGVGATLQFAVLRWAAENLGLPLDRAAYMQAAVAVGVVFGASAAGRWIPLSGAKRMLGAGVVLGLLMPILALATDVWLAAALLVVVGAVGGVMVVPLNALLQHRGCSLLSAGRSVAVQGFNENASVLGMLAIYAGLLALEVGIVSLLCGFGLVIAAAITMLMLRERARDAVGEGQLSPH
jgi:MFS family permease